MDRLQISVPTVLAKYLEEEAKKDGVSVAEVVRRIIRWYMDTYPGADEKQGEGE